MAAAMIIMSALAVQAQRISRADIIRIKSGNITPVKSVAPSKSIIADTARSQGESDIMTDKKATIGSWLETVTFTGDVMPPLKSLSTFTADGGLVVADQGAVTTESVFTPGHGAWNFISGRTFAWTSVEMIYDPATGELIGYLKVNGEYTTNIAASSYTGHFFATVSDPDGNVLFTVDGMNVGNRIGVEPLP